MAPFATWRDSLVVVIRAALGEYRVRGGLPSESEGIVYSDLTFVTIAP